MHKWYLICTISSRATKVHRLVAMAFIPNQYNKDTVNHINWIKTDNNIENLEWCTNSENLKHAHRTWLSKSTVEKLKLCAFNKRKPIIQYDKDWTELKIWDSLSQVSLCLSINKWNICSCCNWSKKYAWWFIWKYK